MGGITGKHLQVSLPADRPWPELGTTLSHFTPGQGKRLCPVSPAAHELTTASQSLPNSTWLGVRMAFWYPWMRAGCWAISHRLSCAEQGRTFTGGPQRPCADWEMRGHTHRINDDGDVPGLG